MFHSTWWNVVSNAEPLIHQGIVHFHNFSDPVLECGFYRAVGQYYCFQKKNISAGIQSYEKALSLAISCGDTKQQSIALEHIAVSMWKIGDYSAAQMHAHEAQRLAKLAASIYEEICALRTEALCCTEFGDYKKCLLLCYEARDHLKLCGLSGGNLDHSLQSEVAEVHLRKSEYIEARSIHSKYLQESSADQHSITYAFVFLAIADIDTILGAPEHEVKHNLEQSKQILGQGIMPAATIYYKRILADLYLREGNGSAAKDMFQQCLNSTWGNDGQTVTDCLERLANVNHWKATNTCWTSTWTVVYLSHAKKSQEKLALHKALCFLGDVFLSEGDEDTAYNLFIVALEGFTYMDVHQSKAHCMVHLGDITEQKGDLDKAVDFWKAAQPLFERSSQTKDGAQIAIRLASVGANK
ncbi:hypothetical protein C8R44DRAFT_188500 [Mycena epipterygia]|nr:hypothetical protein C8R44DRAFT_188500 [Mycena epipterygia]